MQCEWAAVCAVSVGCSECSVSGLEWVQIERDAMSSEGVGCSVGSGSGLECV